MPIFVLIKRLKYTGILSVTDRFCTDIIPYFLPVYLQTSKPIIRAKPHSQKEHHLVGTILRYCILSFRPGILKKGQVFCRGPFYNQYRQASAVNGAP